ncbi:MAG: polysaccharide biosynthesis tyrosine autokinase [Haliscomenobacteraceae bacterium CHB4]|nr:putative tyrosine-protein kinase in cps region [Saprospiraceae bacterium]MCE7926235.1 polysaccharide biosynthesis tyrosine autokinase [Haliscomenobacteraceae bacterium CHB4]
MKEDKIDYRKLLSKALHYWWLYALVFPLAVGLAILYLRKTHPKYEATAMLLIKDEEKSGAVVEQAVLDGLGIKDIKKKGLENEVFILKSTPLMENVVRNLELQYEYFSVEWMKRRDISGDSPVKVVDWKPAFQDAIIEGDVEFAGNGGYLLKVEDQKYQGEFGKELRLPEGKLTLSYNRSKESEGPIGIRVLTPHVKALEFIEGLEVTAVGEQSSTLSLSIKDYVASRAESVLNELIKLYNQQSIDEKNKVFENSLNLLNERINVISQELSSAEFDVESYKRRNNLVEISAEGSLLMRDLADYNKEIAGTDVQLQILSSIQDFLERNKDNFEFVPTNLNINNLTLTNQLTEFNKLLSDRDRQRTQLGPAHPDIILVEKQLRNLRQTIIENIRGIKADIQLGRNAKEQLSASVQSRMASLPGRERGLLDLERNKNLKENLYLYLLEKREQSAISLAVTTAAGRVIEPAKAFDPISPKRAQIYLIALFLGLALPSAVVFGIFSMNDKVMTEDDVQRSVTAPIAGVLALSRKKSKVVVKENSNTAAAEMFRSLRANLAFIAPGQKMQTIIVTSSIPGEGKSFIALNLGVTQALAGKKVLLLELDLRKPSEQFDEIEVADEGVVNYLIDPSVKLDNIIENTGLHLNFDAIRCGPKPPNPSELLLSDRLRDLIKLLRERYDFIILDTPPVGVVADAIQIKDTADATMYVVRSNYTRKAQLRIINDIVQKDKLPRPFIVLNSVQLDKSTYGGYYTSYYGEEK